MQQITVYVLVSFYDENGLHKQGTICKINSEDFNPLYMKKIDVPSGSSSLEDLSDVAISSVDDGEALIYDESTGKWVNGIAGDISGKTIQVRSGAVSVWPPSTATYNFPNNQAFDTSDPDNTVFVLDLKVNGDDHLIIEKSRTSTHLVFEVDPACMYKNTTSNGVFKETGTITLYFKLSDGKHDSTLATVSMADEFGIVPNDATGTLVNDLTSISFGGKYYTIPSGGSNPIAQFGIADLASTEYTIETLPVMQSVDFTVVSGSTDATAFYDGSKTIAQVTSGSKLYFFASNGSVSTGQQSYSGYLCLVPGQYSGQNNWIVLQPQSATTFRITKLA